MELKEGDKIDARAVGIQVPDGSSLIVDTPKPAVKSSVLWAVGGITMTFLDQLQQYLLTVPQGILPKPVQLGIMGVGIVVAIWGQVKKPNSSIEGVLKAPSK